MTQVLPANPAITQSQRTTIGRSIKKINERDDVIKNTKSMSCHIIRFSFILIRVRCSNSLSEYDTESHTEQKGLKRL